MKLLHGLFLFSLGASAGCGGCDSCFGARQPGDDAVPSAVPTPVASPIVVHKRVDAAPVKEEETKTPDAGAAAPAPIATLSAMPRPSGAPMPIGAFQSCGVYDGPRCEKKCDKGNCRQECDGVECDLTCAGGYCSQLCGPQAACRMTCTGGHCIQVCSSPQGCVRECSGGACQ